MVIKLYEFIPHCERLYIGLTTNNNRSGSTLRTIDLTGLIEKIYLDISLKDVPIPSRNTYIKDLVEKFKNLIDRIRRYIFFNFHKGDTGHENEESTDYEFKKALKTGRTPPSSHLLQDFEDKIWNLIPV